LEITAIVLETLVIEKILRQRGLPVTRPSAEGAGADRAACMVVLAGHRFVLEAARVEVTSAVGLGNGDGGRGRRW
jgi:hypothetical protein